MSVRDLTGVAGRKDGSIRRSLASLRSQGIIVTTQRFLANGGQLENGYRLTDLGIRLLRSVAESDCAGRAS